MTSALSRCSLYCLYYTQIQKLFIYSPRNPLLYVCSKICVRKCIPSLKFKASTYIRLEATLLMSINKYHMRSLVQSLSSRVILSARGRGQSREIIMKLPWNFLILPWHSSMSSYLDTCSSSLIGQTDQLISAIIKLYVIHNGTKI